MTPEQRLFQAVIFQAARDATQTPPEPMPPLSKFNGDEKKYAQERSTRQRKLSEIAEADSWFKGARRDFVQVCHMAGMCPDFVHDAYVNGRINRDLMGSYSH